MVRSWLYAFALLAGLAFGGCAIPAEVREKIALEAAIHRGYERHVDTAPIESLRAVVRRSSGAWSALDSVVNPSD